MKSASMDGACSERNGMEPSGELKTGPNGRIRIGVDCRQLVHGWRTRLRELREEAHFESAGYVEEAILATNAGRDPRPDLARRGIELETRATIAQTQPCGARGVLRTMNMEFTQLLEEHGGKR